MDLDVVAGSIPAISPDTDTLGVVSSNAILNDVVVCDFDVVAAGKHAPVKILEKVVVEYFEVLGFAAKINGRFVAVRDGVVDNFYIVEIS